MERAADWAVRPGPLPPTPELYILFEGLFRVPEPALSVGELSQFYGLNFKEQDMSFLEKKANKGGRKAGMTGSPTNPGSQMHLFSAIKVDVFFGPSWEGRSAHPGNRDTWQARGQSGSQG